MAKEKDAHISAWQELFHLGVYKRNQGRVARQVTFAAIAIIWAIGVWSLSQSLMDADPAFRYAVPGMLLGELSGQRRFVDVAVDEGGVGEAVERLEQEFRPFEMVPAQVDPDDFLEAE